MTIHRNVGGVDRAVRLAIGAVLPLAAALAPMGSGWRVVAGTVGGIALATALGGYCPLNQLLGVDTAHGPLVRRARARMTS